MVVSAPRLDVELDALAERIARMRAVGRNGDLEPFFEDRSQAARDAGALAAWARHGRPPSDFVPAAERGPDDRRRGYRQR